MQVLHKDRRGSLGAERRASGCQLIEHNPKRVDVAATIQLFSQYLFWRHVLRRADDGAGLGELSRPLHDLGDAKVGQQAVPLFVDQDVAGLYIAMDQSTRMGIAQRLAHLFDDLSYLFQGQRFPMQQIIQRASFNVRHDDIGISFILSKIMNREDMDMLQPGDQLGFLLETAYEFRVPCEMARQDLKGDIAIHARLIGLIDRRHTPFAQGCHDLVFPELFSSEIFHASLFLFNS